MNLACIQSEESRHHFQHGSLLADLHYSCLHTCCVLFVSASLFGRMWRLAAIAAFSAEQMKQSSEVHTFRRGMLEQGSGWTIYSHLVGCPDCSDSPKVESGKVRTPEAEMAEGPTRPGNYLHFHGLILLRQKKQIKVSIVRSNQRYELDPRITKRTFSNWTSGDLAASKPLCQFDRLLPPDRRHRWWFDSTRPGQGQCHS